MTLRTTPSVGSSPLFDVGTALQPGRPLLPANLRSPGGPRLLEALVGGAGGCRLCPGESCVQAAWRSLQWPYSYAGLQRAGLTSFPGPRGWLLAPPAWALWELSKQPPGQGLLNVGQPGGCSLTWPLPPASPIEFHQSRAFPLNFHEHILFYPRDDKASVEAKHTSLSFQTTLSGLQ